MYIIYLDESGDPNGWNRQNHFVIGGVAIHEGQIWQLNQKIDQIQAKYFPGIQIPIKMHAVDIRGGRDRFRDLTEADRENLLDDIYQVISGTRFPHLIAFATVVHISAVTSPEQALRDTFEDICQRVNTFLVRQFNRGQPNKGFSASQSLRMGRRAPRCSTSSQMDKTNVNGSGISLGSPALR